MPTSPGAGRVLVAESDGPLVASPTWTRYDTLSGVGCSGYDIHRGRQSEFDITEAGTATIFFNDTNQTLNDNDLIGLQIMLQIYNPVDSTWYPQYRGYIDDITYDVDPSGVKSNVQFLCVDMFDFLGAVQMVIGTFGNTPPAGRTGSVFYEDGRVDDRITALLTDASLPSALYTVFTGNVNVQETVYDGSDTILQAIRDAADAEFPGVANIYVDKGGVVQFHGREARFDPATVSASASGWDYNTWKAGDGAAISGDSNYAMVKTFAFNRPRSRIINTALAYPRGIKEDDIPSLVVTDATSISNYGHRGWNAPDLIVLNNFNNSNTGADECLLYGTHYKTNYSIPRKNIQRLMVTSLHPGDGYAASNWDFVTGIDISDTVTVNIGDATVNEDFFVEGMDISVRPATDSYDYVEIVPNLTPAAFYTTDPF
jgi:hypothetical protein